MTASHYEIDGVDLTTSTIELITYNGSNLRIAKHSYSAPNSDTKKVLTLIPGYTETAGYLKVYIHFFLDLGYKVNCYELPGHGESTGDRYDIDNFKTYQLFHNEILKDVDTEKENIFLSHSTGCVGISQSLLDNQEQPFSKILLIAPLVRTFQWHPSVLAFKALSPFIKNIFRVHQLNYPEYLSAIKTDPHYLKNLPLSWLQQLLNFYKLAKQETRLATASPLVLLGTKDKVVDWKYGRKYYLKHFPSAKNIIIKGGFHHLHFNEDPVKTHVFAEISDFLNKN